MKIGRPIVLAGAFLLLIAGMAGCAGPAKREYVDPQGAEAEQCLQFCQRERFVCRTPIQRRDEDCQYRYRIVYAQFLRCLEVRGNRGGCVRPGPCPVPNYSGCSEGYDQCFVGCGGRIIGEEDDDYRVD
ncbi:MAG: hypothetical protein AAF358_11955 [Pseudomonadota bacterium]